MNKANFKFVDYVFWITLIFFTNPGGILIALGEDSSDGGINVTDFLFVILSGCFLIVYKIDFFRKDRYFVHIFKYLVVFLIYYLVVFTFFVPQFKNNPDYTVVTSLIKVRHGLINIFLVGYCYIFFLRSYPLFFKIFTSTSIIVIILFIITVFSGIDILPIKNMDRGFISIERQFMMGYGLMPLLISMGVVLLVFNFKFKSKNWILLGFVLMYVAWILALTRREIFGAILMYFLTISLKNFMERKALINVSKVFSLILYGVILLFVVRFTLPKYYDAVVFSAGETWHTIQYGETSFGRKDVRLGFGKDALQEKIIDNYIIGTGFDNNWRTSEEAGYEASDYPFLAAIAMTGIIGLIVFLPVYIKLLKGIYQDVKSFKKNRVNPSSFEDYVLLVFIIFFLFDLITYVYWFLPVSLFTHADHKKWYIFLAFYIAARRIYYSKQFELINKKVIHE